LTTTVRSWIKTISYLHNRSNMAASYYPRECNFDEHEHESSCEQQVTLWAVLKES